MATKEINIEPQRWYTMQDIVRFKFFSFRSSVWSVRNIIKADHEKGEKGILTPIVRGTGRGTKYLIKGEKIIKFIKLVESGKISI